jgi:hypothetical protein
MKALLLMTAVVIGVALVAGPADAASKKRKQTSVTRAPVTMPHANRNVVRDSDGTIIGTDPDPFIRAMMRRDPRPWDSPM